MLTKELKILQSKSDEIDLKNNLETGEIVSKLKNTLKHIGGGAGLSAPQIGINKRVFIWSPNRDINDIKIAFNPEIVDILDLQEIEDIEGCFSFPLEIYSVKRLDKIRVKFYNENKLLEIIDLCGFEARIFQHELDHLDGIMLTHKGRLFQKFKNDYALKKFLIQRKQTNTVKSV